MIDDSKPDKKSHVGMITIPMAEFKKLNQNSLTAILTCSEKEWENSVSKMERLKMPDGVDMKTLQSKFPFLSEIPLAASFKMPDFLNLGDRIIVPSDRSDPESDLPNYCTSFPVWKKTVQICLPGDIRQDPPGKVPGKTKNPCGIKLNEFGEISCSGKCEYGECIGVMIIVNENIQIIGCMCRNFLVKLKEFAT